MMQSRGWTPRKWVPVSGMRPRRRVALGKERYSEDMRILQGSSLAQFVQGDRNRAMDKETIEKQITGLAPRANFAQAYVARGGTLGNGQKLDPVLASHLGLQEPAK